MGQAEEQVELTDKRPKWEAGNKDSNIQEDLLPVQAAAAAADTARDSVRSSRSSPVMEEQRQHRAKALSIPCSKQYTTKHKDVWLTGKINFLNPAASFRCPKSLPRDLWCIYQPRADVSDTSDLYHCVLSWGFDPLLLILKVGQWTGTNSNQLEAEQLCDDPGCTCSCLMDLTEGSGQLSSCLAQPRGHLSQLTETPAPHHVCWMQTLQLSTVTSHNHGCRTGKKQCNQAPGIPH